MSILSSDEESWVDVFHKHYDAQHGPYDFRHIYEVDEELWAYADALQAESKRRKKMNQDERERQLLLEFLGWIEKQGYTICYLLNPQDEHSYVPTSRPDEQRVRDFLFSKSAE